MRKTVIGLVSLSLATLAACSQSETTADEAGTATDAVTDAGATTDMTDDAATRMGTDGATVDDAMAASTDASGVVTTSTGQATTTTITSSTGVQQTYTWPASLRVMGNGYPNTGDPCRRLGETAAVSDYLDDSATLVGCPARRNSPMVASIVRPGHTKIVGEVDGVTILSVTPAPAGSSPTTSRTTSVNLTGSVTGAAVQRHVFKATQGQKISVTLGGPGTMYFNVIPPGGDNADAVYVGSRSDNADSWSGVAKKTGDYSVLVYLMGNDKDSGATRNYTIKATAQ